MSQLKSLLSNLPAIAKELASLAKATPAALLALPGRIERSGLAIREFTALLPIDRKFSGDYALREELAGIDRLLADTTEPRRAKLAQVPGIHSGRLMLLDDTDNLKQLDRQRARESGPNAQGPLLISLVYDGSLDSILAELLEGPELSSVLQYCEGYPSADGGPTPLTGRAAAALRARRIAWLKQAQLKGGYFFSDISHQSREEIDRAAALWRDFREFYIAHQGQPVAAVRRDFTQFWHERAGEPMPRASRLETHLRHEERWSRRVAELGRRGQRLQTLARDAQGLGPARALHAKHHGCVSASFSVRSDIPARLQRGLFATARSYQAWIRLSNSAPSAGHDASPDGRGCAIKLLGVQGEWLLPETARKQAAYPGDGEAGHDFILLSHPNFFAKNVKELALFLGAQSTGDGLTAARLITYFARRPRSLRILLQTLVWRIRHPLDITYHSATPYLLGERRAEDAPAVKYSVRPRLGARESFALRATDRTHPNFLSEALVHSLHPSYGDAIELDFCLHVPNGKRLSVEDACADWSDAEVIPVATITIPKQDVAAPEHLDRAERLVFSPWHALRVHQPLGSLNRARLPIYRASAQLRSALRPLDAIEPPGTKPTAESDSGPSSPLLNQPRSTVDHPVNGRPGNGLEHLDREPTRP